MFEIYFFFIVSKTTLGFLIKIAENEQYMKAQSVVILLRPLYQQVIAIFQQN